MNLYLFNPEHDYALANNDPHFMAPASAVRFADECALFLQYLIPEDGILFLPYREHLRFYDTATKAFMEHPPHIDKIVPWGWDALMRQQCSPFFTGHLLDAQRIANTHALAHRANTISAMEFLREQCPSIEIPTAATLLLSAKEVEKFVTEQREVILKSPYSGNGRGNLYAHEGQYTPTLARQSSGVIRRQGAILGEPLYNLVQDFALEFLCHKGRVSFAGYSLFNTRHYGYAGNVLCSDECIEHTLSQWVSISQLHEIRTKLTTYLQMFVAPDYDGYVGVDMFVYQENREYKINPMVEMNIRMTMGMAAHILYEKYVHPNATGTMELLYRPKPGEIHAHITSQPPMQYQDDKWFSGTLALNPITETTQYAVIVEVKS
ncbi:MAG: hypothetical protein MJZ57_06375 [Bacteroidales bacterium]|nr:hypothetical protein [Bacteroidales bacterium]